MMQVSQVLLPGADTDGTWCLCHHLGGTGGAEGAEERNYRYEM
jgi:hypothetical protein